MEIILRQVYIYKDKDLLYYRHFGKALKQETFDGLVSDLMEDAFGRGGGKKDVQNYDYYKYRISYVTEPELNLMFLFVTGLTDKSENIKKEILKCKKEFLNLFEDILQHKFDAKTFEVFDPTIDSIHKNLRPKLSLVGFSGVGKTTITRLIKAEEIPMQHIPTITGDIATIKIGKLHFHLWDFAGQEQFSYLWTNFIKGSDAVLLITDSSLENVEKSKFFLELIKEQADDAHTAVIGNKQDLPEAMKPEQIEKIIGLKTYSMIAKDPGNRDKMIQIIADVLEMNSEVSPLLKPLLERDELTKEVEESLENGDFQKAVILLEKISDLCIDLGDDSLGKEFYEKSQKIKGMLEKVGATEEPAQEVPETTQTTGEEKQTKVQAQTQESTEPPKPPKPPESTEPPKPPKPPESTEPPKPPKVTESPEVPDKKEASEEEEEVLIKPKALKKTGGISLNPADFMIKQRPKSIKEVPKDAKTKLKTSPFAEVKNPESNTPRKPVSPTALFSKPKIKKKEIPQKEDLEIKKPPKPPAPPKLEKPSIPRVRKEPEERKEEEQAEADTHVETKVKKKIATDDEQKKNVEKTLIDLKIKKTNISKMLLDFEMQELTGEITSEELEEKTRKIEAMKTKIDDQIKELEEFL